jgi:muscarinic acetylcholine receptor M3
MNSILINNNTFSNESLINSSILTSISNSSDQSYQPWRASHVFTLLITLPLILVGIAGNGLVISSWFVDKRIRTPSNALLVSLALPDILLWIFGAPLRLNAIIRDGNWLQGRFMCEAEMIAAYIFPFVSSEHLVLIAVDRYRILTEGVPYLQRRTTRSVLEPVAWLWFIGFWLISPLLVDWEGTGIYQQDANTGRWVCGTKKTATFVLPFVLATAVLPELLLIRLYTEIYQMLKIRFTHKEFSTGKEQHDHSSGTESTGSSGKGNKKDDQQTKTSSIGNDGSLLANQGTTMVDHHRQAEADRKERMMMMMKDVGWG